jgi:hypothetical protein
MLAFVVAFFVVSTLFIVNFQMLHHVEDLTPGMDIWQHLNLALMLVVPFLSEFFAFTVFKQDSSVHKYAGTGPLMGRRGMEGTREMEEAIIALGAARSPGTQRQSFLRPPPPSLARASC